MAGFSENGSNTTAVLADRGRVVTRPASPTVLIDATGVLRELGTIPTGIPRVEQFLFRGALDDEDANVGVVRLESRRGVFRFMRKRHRKMLEEVTRRPAARRGRGAGAFAEAFALVWSCPPAGPEADRQLAADIASSRFGYAVAKAAIRFWRSICRRLDAIAGLPDRSDRSECPRGIVLMSNGSFLSRHGLREQPGLSLAFICHDMIPVLCPDLTASATIAERFRRNLGELLDRGALALCASQTSADMLADYWQKQGRPPVAMSRFAMPSILHRMAMDAGRVSRLEPAEAFVLYCSTIEVRKNHLLLARIWLRALREGVVLPKLICVGKWGWNVDELKSLLLEHPRLSESISFPGRVGDAELIDLYRSARFGVFPSRIEGWGFGASECLDFGVPVIVSTAPALIEATGGLMPAIDPDDEEGWYLAIRRLAEDPAWHGMLAERIAQQHRPTPPEESWKSIKAAITTYAPSVRPAFPDRRLGGEGGLSASRD